MSSSHENLGSSPQPRKATARAVGRAVTGRSFLGLKPERSAPKEAIKESAFAAQALHYRSPYAKAWRQLRGVHANF